MEILSYILIGISLAMDAFAVCVCQGIASKEDKKKLGIKLALTFGAFQSLMPYIGYKIGNIFSSKISTYGSLLAGIILIGIGINMLKEASKDEECALINNYKVLLFLAIATSIDALVVGFSFALDNRSNIIFGIILIGVVTFIISYLGTTIGSGIKKIVGKASDYFGGIVLIVLGIKSLADKFLF